MRNPAGCRHCENKSWVVIDADNGKQLAELPIGSRTDGAA